MRKKWIVASALIVFAIAFAAAWLGCSGRVSYLTLNGDLKVKVNGVIVEGDVLGNRVSAIVTRRDKGNQHSYMLLSEGDADSNRDIGSVVDCQE